MSLRVPPSAGSLRGMCFYAAFLVQHGQDSALVRLIVMLSEGAAGCAERALSLDVAGREIEFALASRLALTVSGLSETTPLTPT